MLVFFNYKFKEIMKKRLLLSLLVVFTVSCNNKKQDKKEERKPTEKTVSVKDENVKEKNNVVIERKKPVNGKLKGVIELGASGFNFFVVNIDKNKNWSLLKKKSGKSFIVEGKTTPDDVSAKIKKYISKITEYGVDKKDIHFVISSGAKKEAISKVISKEIEKIGYTINEVNPREEGQYAFKVCVPKEYQSKAFCVDIGSGNTKISFLKDNTIKAQEAFGSKYFKKDYNDKTVYKNVRTNASSVPKEQTLFCFIIGGVARKMAKQSRKDDERFVLLNTDVNTYKKLADKKGKKMHCGLNIYKAIVDETECKNIIFDWEANFAIGFLLDLPY